MHVDVTIDVYICQSLCEATSYDGRQAQEDIPVVSGPTRAVPSSAEVQDVFITMTDVQVPKIAWTPSWEMVGACWCSVVRQVLKLHPNIYLPVSYMRYESTCNGI